MGQVGWEGWVGRGCLAIGFHDWKCYVLEGMVFFPSGESTATYGALGKSCQEEAGLVTGDSPPICEDAQIQIFQ